MPTKGWLDKKGSWVIQTSLATWTSRKLKENSCISSKKHKTEIHLCIGKSYLIWSLNFDREQLQRNAREGNFYLRISMDHLLNFDEILAQ